MTLRTRTTLTAIGSGKGGTGKTFVSIALAQALSLEGERVLLCDVDFGLANTPVQLGIGPCGDMDAALRGAEISAELVAAVNGGIRVRGGFDLVAAQPGSGALADIAPSTAEKLVAALRAASRYDRVILDLAAGVEAATMALAAGADESMVVVTPDPAALTDAYAFVKLVLRRGGRLPHALVNIAANDAEARRVGDALAQTCRAFLKQAPDSIGTIPRDPRVAECVRRQAQLLSEFPRSPASCAIQALAGRLHEQLRPAQLSAGSLR